MWDYLKKMLLVNVIMWAYIGKPPARTINEQQWQIIFNFIFTHWKIYFMLNTKHMTVPTVWILQYKYNLKTYMNSIFYLRVRAFFHKTVRVCHVYFNFKIGFTCRITVILRTLKDGSLLINTLASNICFSYKNIFQNFDACQK